MDEYINTLQEANDLGLDISFCNQGDINCLQKLISKYKNTLQEANDLGLDTSLCNQGDINCLQNLINSITDFGR